jgi:3-hydroxyisobutyrate dehydrogenase-like beta-hydroxyacid dehydrogenase
MSEVSVLGLGPMGYALAATLRKNGRRVTVWNRTRARAEPLLAGGAAWTASPAEAIGASPVSIVCVADYAVSDELLRTEQLAPLLSGKLLVQLSTGTPTAARDAERWTRALGAQYLDGAILAVPSQMGGPESSILASGEQGAFQRAEVLLRALAPSVIYLGADAGAAAARDLAVLSYLYGAVVGFYHGARILEVERQSVGEFGRLVADIAPTLGAMISHEGQLIHEDRYENPENTLAVSARALKLILRQAREAQINDELPRFASDLFERAVAAGHGEEALAAVMKVLRER